MMKQTQHYSNFHKLLDITAHVDIARSISSDFRGTSARYLAWITGFVSIFLFIFYFIFDLLPTFRVAYPTALWIISDTHDFLLTDSGFLSWLEGVTQVKVDKLDFALQIILVVVLSFLTMLLTAAPSMMEMLFSVYAKKSFPYADKIVYAITTFDTITDYPLIYSLSVNSVYPFMRDNIYYGDTWGMDWVVYIFVMFVVSPIATFCSTSVFQALFQVTFLTWWFLLKNFNVSVINARDVVDGQVSGGGKPKNQQQQPNNNQREAQ